MLTFSAWNNRHPAPTSAPKLAEPVESDSIAAAYASPQPDFWTDCGQPATIPCMTPKPIQPYSRLEHIEVQTHDGPARLLVKRHYDASNVSGAAYGLDWWRTPEAPKKGRMRRMLNALLRPDKT